MASRQTVTRQGANKRKSSSSDISQGLQSKAKSGRTNSDTRGADHCHPSKSSIAASPRAINDKSNSHLGARLGIGPIGGLGRERSGKDERPPSRVLEVTVNAAPKKRSPIPPRWDTTLDPVASEPSRKAVAGPGLAMTSSMTSSAQAASRPDARLHLSKSESWDDDFCFEEQHNTSQSTDTRSSADLADRSAQDDDCDDLFWDDGEDDQEMLSDHPAHSHSHLPRAASTWTIKANAAQGMTPSSSIIHKSFASNSHDSSGTEIGTQDMIEQRQALRKSAGDQSTQDCGLASPSMSEAFPEGEHSRETDNTDQSSLHTTAKERKSLSKAIGFAMPWRKASRSKLKGSATQASTDDATPVPSKLARATQALRKRSSVGMSGPPPSPGTSYGGLTSKASHGDFGGRAKAYQKLFGMRSPSVSTATTASSYMSSEHLASEESFATSASTCSSMQSPDREGQRSSRGTEHHSPETSEVHDTPKKKSKSKLRPVNTEPAMPPKHFPQMSQPSKVTELQDLHSRTSRSNSLGDLKIPARITDSQSKLRSEMSRLKDFAQGVRDLKILRQEHSTLLRQLARVPASKLARSGFGDIESRFRSWWECAEVIINLGDGKSDSPTVDTGVTSVDSTSIDRPAPAVSRTSGFAPVRRGKQRVNTIRQSSGPTFSFETPKVSPTREMDILATMLDDTNIDQKSKESAHHLSSSQGAVPQSDPAIFSRFVNKSSSPTFNDCTGSPRSPHSAFIEGRERDIGRLHGNPAAGASQASLRLELLHERERLRSFGHGGNITLKGLLEMINISKAPHLSADQRHRRRLSLVRRSITSSPDKETFGDYDADLQALMELENAPAGSGRAYNTPSQSSPLVGFGLSSGRSPSPTTARQPPSTPGQKIIDTWHKRRISLVKMMNLGGSVDGSISTESEEGSCLEREPGSSVLDVTSAKAEARTASANTDTLSRRPSMHHTKRLSTASSIGRDSGGSSATTRSNASMTSSPSNLQHSHEYGCSPSLSSKTSSMADDAAMMRKLAMRPETMSRLLDYVNKTTTRCRECVQQLEQVHKAVAAQAMSAAK